MAEEFRKIDPEVIGDNVFQMIGQDWMLISSGKKGASNMMTASWGGLGVLWNKKVCFVFVRPTRYTYELLEQNDYFTLNFFEEEHKEILEFCGTNSGRDVDKLAKCELTPLETTNKAIYYQESRLVIECKKIYYQDIDPEQFLDQEINSLYSDEDYHRMYIGEIVNIFEKIE